MGAVPWTFTSSRGGAFCCRFLPHDKAVDAEVQFDSRVVDRVVATMPQRLEDCRSRQLGDQHCRSCRGFAFVSVTAPHETGPAASIQERTHRLLAAHWIVLCHDGG